MVLEVCLEDGNRDCCAFLQKDLSFKAHKVELCPECNQEERRIRMDNYDKYEIKAKAFRLMTGYTAPGKDPPSGSYPPPYEERQKAWEKWLNDNRQCINAMLQAFERENYDICR